MTLQEAKKQGLYVWRFKPIRFNGTGPATPMRASNELDKHDFVFADHDTFQKWYRRVTAGLAELDEVMNYCKYFVRERGNKGHYVRDGKSFPVNGLWTGLHHIHDLRGCQPFVQWLEQNGWKDNWFELMDKYKNDLELEAEPIEH